MSNKRVYLSDVSIDSKMDRIRTSTQKEPISWLQFWYKDISL